MDNFMDKLAQRFNAQEIIKANSQAEMQELNRLKTQMKAYDDCLQEMRKLNLKNVEIAQQVDALTGQMSELTGQAIHAIQRNAEKDNTKIEASLQEIMNLRKEINAALAELKTTIQEKAQTDTDSEEKLLESNKKTEEYVHKECVKVYRNVQAVLGDELANQTKQLEEKIVSSHKGKAAIYVLLVLTLLASLGNLGIILAQMFGVI